MPHTEEDFREAARTFTDAGDSLRTVLGDAVRLIALDPVFGGTAVHALDRVVTLDDRAQLAADDCSSQASVAETRADLIVGWRNEELAYRERREQWEAERHQWEIANGAHETAPDIAPPPGEPPVEPTPPDPPPAWADLGI